MVELKTTAKAIYDGLKKRRVPVEVLDPATSLMRYQWKGHWRLLRSSTPPTNSSIGLFVCDRKPLASAIAEKLEIPTPAMCLFTTSDDPKVNVLIKKHKPIVVKPAMGAHGHGVTVGVTDRASLRQAMESAVDYLDDDGTMIAQQQVYGDDIRVLVIGGKVVAVAHRIPARVTGNGKLTIKQLITKENRNPKRGVNYQKTLNIIDMAAAERFVGGRFDEIPAKGEVVQVVGTANIGSGGEASDVTDELRRDAPEVVGYAEALSEALGLDVCGVDFMWDRAKGRISFIECNACPSFGLHLRPSHGQGRDVTKAFLDLLLTD